MKKEELAKIIYSVSNIKGNFVLPSGNTSNKFFDKYQFESNPNLLKEVVLHLKPLINFNFDMVAGLEIGGIPIAAILGVELNKPIVYVRKEPKTYGTAKFVEGIDIVNKDLLIVDDIMISGWQILNSSNALRREGAIVNKALCVIEKEQGGRETLKNEGIELISLFKMSELKN